MAQAVAKTKSSQSNKASKATKPVAVSHVPAVKSIIQPKLKIGQPNDKYEQEADRVADQVMRMPEPQKTSSNQSSITKNSSIGSIQRKCSACSKEDELVQRKSTNITTPEVTPNISSSISSLQGGGVPMSKSERSFFEPRFGKDFSNVRIHSGGNANAAAASINAKAFTLGNNIVFNSGEYSPNTFSSKKLMSHELMHVIQQNGEGYGNKKVLPPLLHFLAIQRKEEKATDSLKITTDNIDDAISIMWKTYQILVRTRREAVDKLLISIEQEKKSSPSFIKELLFVAITSGILGPTGLIGGAIANKIIEAGEDASAKAKIGNDAITNAINAAVKVSLTKTYNETIGSIGDKDEKIDKETRKIFFLTLKSFLSTQSDNVEVYFLNNAYIYRDMEKKKRGSGVDALKVLQDSVIATLHYADRIQRERSLDEWLVYMAKNKLGVQKEKQLNWQQGSTDLSKIMGQGAEGQPTRTPGVLMLELHTLNDDARVPVKIRNAWISGLNLDLRNELENRPIKELGIPVIAWSHSTPFHRFSVGINEAGKSFISTKGNRYLRNILLYLSFKVTHRYISPDDAKEISDEKLAAFTYPAARQILFFELGRYSLKDLKVDLKSSYFE